MKFQKEGKRKNSTKVIEYILRIDRTYFYILQHL